MIIPSELLGLSDINILEIYLRDNRELIIKVESTQTNTPCRNCGKTCKAHGYDRPMELRHLPVLSYKTYIQLTPKRGLCTDCDDKVNILKTIDGRDRKPVESFLNSIPKRLKHTVSAVCSDLYEGYINAAKKIFGNKVITADRFHVANIISQTINSCAQIRIKEIKKNINKRRI